MKCLREAHIPTRLFDVATSMHPVHKMEKLAGNKSPSDISNLSHGIRFPFVYTCSSSVFGEPSVNVATSNRLQPIPFILCVTLTCALSLSLSLTATFNMLFTPARTTDDKPACFPSLTLSVTFSYFPSIRHALISACKLRGTTSTRCRKDNSSFYC